jgi:spermidine synthase
MFLSMALLFAYQNLCGYLYEKVGLLVALYMLGLSIGGFFLIRIFDKNKIDADIGIVILDLAICLIAILIPYVINFMTQHISSSIIFPIGAMIILVGAASGGQFPLASSLVDGEGENAGIGAAASETADHLGAALGALLAGTVLLPLLGVKWGCFFVGSVKLFSGFLILLLVKRKPEN